MATCKKCGKMYGFFEGGGGLCGECFAAGIVGEDVSSTTERRKAEAEADAQDREAAKNLPVTTETFVGDVERLGVVATEVVLGMNIFKDVLANVRDIFGGRSGAVQDTLEEARTLAFEDLKFKAVKLGADAVIAVDIDYHSISTGSAVNMMMVSVSGTAIKWQGGGS